MRCNSKIHVIKDESLGGVKREYIKNYEDIIANLVRRVAELERRDEEHRHVIERMGLEVDAVERSYGELFSDVKRDVETWAQEVEGLRNDLAGYRDDYLAIGSAVEDVDAKVEMCIDDIVTLDERSRKAQTITLDVDTFTEIIGGAR